MEANKRQKTVLNLMEGLSDEHRRMVAEGIATMHRFATTPVLKHGKAKYKGNTVAAMSHLKEKSGS